MLPPTGGIIFECNKVADGGFFINDQSECQVPPNGLAFSSALLFISAIFGCAGKEDIKGSSPKLPKLSANFLNSSWESGSSEKIISPYSIHLDLKKEIFSSDKSFKEKSETLTPIPFLDKFSLTLINFFNE